MRHSSAKVDDLKKFRKVLVEKSSTTYPQHPSVLTTASHSARGAGEPKLAEKVVAVRHLAFTLVYLDEHTGLVVLRLLAWDTCVELDKDGHLPTRAASRDTDE